MSGLGLIAILSTFAVLLGLILVVVSRAQAIVAEFGKLLSHFKPLYGWGQRLYIKESLEFRTGRMLKGLRGEAPFLTEKLSIDWVDPNTERDAFLKQDSIVVCLKSEDRNEENLVHAIYLFVTTSLLFRAKRYLSSDQRDSLDLFVTAKLLEQADESLVDIFLAEYLLPHTDGSDPAVSDYFSAYETLTRVGLFFAVLLRELEFLGYKVFGKRLVAELPQEVDELIDMNETVALRPWGERVDLTLIRRYCRVAVVIVGMRQKLEDGIDAWTSFIDKSLIPRDIESIYLLGLWRNREQVDQVADRYAEVFEAQRYGPVPGVFADGQQRDQVIWTLHKRSASVFQARTQQTRRRFGTGLSAASALAKLDGRSLGTVVSFGKAGYGFIALDDGEREAFFHLNDCVDPPAFIVRGDRVECVATQGDRGLTAIRVQFLWLVATEKSRAQMAEEAVEREVDPLVQIEESSGSVAIVERPPETAAAQGRVVAEVTSWGAKDFGFLRTRDGIEAYFHLNDCLDAPAQIRPGQAVTCEIEPNVEDRPHARRVTFESDPVSEDVSG